MLQNDWPRRGHHSGGTLPARSRGITRRRRRFAPAHPTRASRTHHRRRRDSGHLALSVADFMSWRSLSASLVGGWQTVPVQRKTDGASFVGNVLANGSTGPTLPRTTLFG